MKSQDEEFAKTSFTSFIPGGLNIVWEDVCQLEEPPDYYLTIDENRFAVEVTLLFDKIKKDGKLYPSLAISMSLRNFVKELEKQAKDKGILASAYAVGLTPLSTFYEIKDQLIKKLLVFIEKTQKENKTNEEVILEKGFERLSIEKIHKERNSINEVITFTPKWEGESKLELKALLSKSIQNKKEKLIDINEPKILLIIDAFNYVDGKFWQEAVEDSKEVKSFHTICRISGSGETQVLNSYNSAWMEAH